MAGATTLGDLASAIGARSKRPRSSPNSKPVRKGLCLADWRISASGVRPRLPHGDRSSDAADTTQEVFLKVFRGMKHFHGESSLKTWIYRIALHEAANRKRWWFRHKAQETSIEPAESEGCPTAMEPCSRRADRSPRVAFRQRGASGIAAARGRGITSGRGAVSHHSDSARPGRNVLRRDRGDFADLVWER